MNEEATSRYEGRRNQFPADVPARDRPQLTKQRPALKL